MFIGYQNNTARYIKDTREELEVIPHVSFDKIEEVPFAEMYNGVVYTSEDSFKQAKGEAVRATRNRYLETYVDPIVSNPLRWSGLTSDEQKNYTDYRQYLLDITAEESFPDLVVLTFDEWLALPPVEPEVVEEQETVEEIDLNGGIFAQPEEEPSVELAEGSDNEAVEPSEASEDVVELYSMEI